MGNVASDHFSKVGALCLAALLVGCGSSDVPADGGSLDAEVADSGTLCVVGAACQDDRFCNGREQCIPASPHADRRGCVVSSVPACGAGFVCDETMDICESTCPDADADGERAASCGAADCDDANAAINTTAADLCNGVDDDCDGMVDDGVLQGAGCSVGVGACARSALLTCADGAYSLCPTTAGAPGLETCNGIDDDCNGLVDDGAALLATCAIGLGACERAGIATCEGGIVGCEGTPGTPIGEACNGVDDDCDGVTDNALGCSVEVVELSTAESTTCARLSTGRVVCWGLNDRSGLGDGAATHVACSLSDDCSPTALYVIGVSDAVQVSVNSSFTCARRAGGGVACWGSNRNGELGRATPSLSELAGDVPGLTDVVDVAAGATHACAVQSDGTVACWGSNALGQCGVASPTRILTPQDVPGVSDAIAVEAGGFHTCVVRRSGVVSCWGKNVDGQLGDGTSVRRSTPGDVLGVANVVQLSISSDNAVARTASGTVFQWGNTLRTAATVPSLTDAEYIAAGDHTTCARRASGETVCWGGNSDGQFGDGSVSAAAITTPAPVGYLRNASFFEAGFRHFCAKLESGVVTCAGANFYGQVGNGTFSDVDQVFAMPVRFP